MSHCDAIKLEVPIDPSTFPYFISDHTSNKNRTQKNFDAMVSSGLVVDYLKDFKYNDQYTINKNRTQKIVNSVFVNTPIPR